MIDINKQFEKLGISFNILDDGKIEFILSDGIIKLIDQKKLEQYLFICMLDFIKDEN